MGIDASHPDWTIIARVVSGQADPAETAGLERWAGDDPHRRTLVESSRALWRQGGTPLEQVDVDDALERIKGLRPPRRRMLRFPGADEPTGAVRWRRTAWSVARVALAGGVAAAAVLWLNAERESRTAAEPIRISEVSTRRGERAQLRLPDGTQLVLAPASTVRYASDYGMARREVTLEGQALFVVTHDELRPFVVRTTYAVATDLGTTFVVRAYDEDQAAEVMVSEGKVAVVPTTGGRAGPPTTETLLDPGDLVRVATDGRVDVRRGVAGDPYLAWSRGRLAFEDTPLADVLRQLSRWYDIDARVADSVAARRRLTASYTTEPLADILRLVAASLDLRVERHGRSVIFSTPRVSHPRGEF